MIFSIEHSFDDMYLQMAREKVISNATFVQILKKSAKILIQDLEANAPDSLRSYARAASKNYTKAAEKSRAKYGEMNKALGMYKARIQGGIGMHAVNVGYLPSKQDKAFVSNFLNYGWLSSNGRFNTVHLGFIQKAEQRSLPAMKLVFDAEVEKTFEVEMQKVFERRKMRRL
jgi:hypothetical protein